MKIATIMTPSKTVEPVHTQINIEKPQITLSPVGIGLDERKDFSFSIDQEEPP